MPADRNSRRPRARTEPVSSAPPSLRRRSLDEAITRVGPPPTLSAAPPPDDGDTTRVERPSFATGEPLPRLPYDELYDAVETGVGSASSLWMSLSGFARLRQQAAARHAWERALPLRRALRLRLRVAGWAVPILIPLLAMGVLGLVAGLLLGRGRAARVAPPRPVSLSASAPSARSVAPPRAAENLLARASRGELDAIAAVERTAPEERDSSAVLALRRGRLEHERQVLAEIGRPSEPGAGTGSDPDMLGRVDRALSDPRLAIDALAALVRQPGSIAADLLYEVSQDAERDAEVSAVADELLRAADVLPRASPALRTALALRAANDCRSAALALHDAAATADARSVPSLEGFARNDPCGEDASEDCMACRGAMLEIGELAAAAGERAYPVRLARKPVWSGPPPAAPSQSPPRLPVLRPPMRPAPEPSVSAPRPAPSAAPTPFTALASDPGF